MTTKTAHFTMTGAGFTKLVRSRMLDDAPGSAFRLAGCLLASDPIEQNRVPSLAIRLCNGTAKMTGDEKGMDLVDDDTVSGKRYRERVQYLFAGRIRVREKWYRPVAYVTDVGPNDVGCNPREKHYCNTDDIVLEQASYPDKKFPSIKRGVIFTQCGERPHWHEVPRGAQEALDEYLTAGGKLEERSHSKWYPERPAKSKRFAQGPNRFEGTYDKQVGLDVDDPQYETAVALSKEEQEALLEKRYAEEDAARLRRVADLRVLILKQAGDDLIEFTWPDKMSEYDDPPKLVVPAGTTKIPRAPFLIWAFARMTFLKMKLPEWKTISPPGMKMMGDDENHTDWVIGGGFDPRDREFYGLGVYNKAAEELRTKFQNEHDDRRQAEWDKVTTLVTGATVQGLVHHGKLNKPAPRPGMIIVLPNLNPKYLVTVAGAAAVITQEGGALAHLAQVGLEQGLPMVRKDDALEMYTEQSLVEVNAEARTAKVLKYHYNDPGDVDDNDD